MDARHKIETRSLPAGLSETKKADGMIVEWDAPITMDDGLVLRADIFRPVGNA